MAPDDLDGLAEAMATGTAPALVGAVHSRDAIAVQVLLGRLDVIRLRALAVVLADEVAVLHDLPDVAPPQTRKEARMEDYAYLRRTGSTVADAAARVGIGARQARMEYEPMLRECAS